MQIGQITEALENWAPLSFQEDFDNCGITLTNSLEISNLLNFFDVY